MRFTATRLLPCPLLIPLALAFLPRLSAFAIVSLPYRASSGESHHMPGLLQRLLPREEGFFDLFVQQAENIHAGAAALLKMLSQYTGVPEQVQSIKAIEHEGDEIAHSLLTKLNQTFITPFDHEDIHELCSRLDDVIDLIDAAASRFVLYRVDPIRPGTLDLPKVLVTAASDMIPPAPPTEPPERPLTPSIHIHRSSNLPA